MQQDWPEPRIHTHVVRYNYQSLVTPSSVFDYDMNTHKASLLKETEVPGGFSERITSPSVCLRRLRWHKIPLSMVYRKGTKLDGSAPLLLYGYGSYGVSIAPTFSSKPVAACSTAGSIYAIAHIRGGGEMGEAWRDAGRMMKKMNTFTDFIASADYLVKHKYTSSDRLVIQGGSAGGMLMGAVDEHAARSV